ncbi:MAG: GNAT family N-acetyltransferase [Planctomycetes bacterium]|nr:GNAT family N-acetyltransferase [Planctomycetota bacterium]MCC7171943.1 GNAT family N-acetyltransferase [Planctomycetota bacterium]
MGDLAQDVTIRPARTDDVGAIAALCGELGYPMTTDQCARRFVALPELHVVLVAVDAARTVLGFAHAHAAEPLLLDRTAELATLVVAADRRGRRIGHHLVDAIAAWAKGAGFLALRLRSNVVRVDAHRFYERLGFTRSKQQVVFDRGL